MERQEDIRQNYSFIKITLEDLEKVVNKEDLKAYENLKNKFLEENIPFNDNHTCLCAYGTKMYVTGGLIPESLFDFVNKLPDEKRNTFTYKDLKEQNLDLSFASKDELILTYAHKSLAEENKLLEYFNKKEHVRPDLDKYDRSISDKIIILFALKDIENKELLDNFMGLVENRKVDKHLLIAFIKSLNNEEKLFLFPKNPKQIKEFEKTLVQTNYGYPDKEVIRQIVGFANLNEEMIDDLSKHLENKKCLEICSGTGLFASKLQSKSVDVIPTDIANKNDNDYLSLRTESFTDVKKLDGLEAIEKYDADVLIMSWPTYNASIASESLKAFLDKNPNGEVLYIGENKGGCTADWEFFEYIEKNNLKMEELPVKYESLIDIHDKVYSIHELPRLA